jgi:hypothetical protein
VMQCDSAMDDVCFCCSAVQCSASTVDKNYMERNAT